MLAWNMAANMSRFSKLLLPEFLNFNMFYFQKTNELNSKLCEEIQRDRRYVLTPSSVNDVYFLRFSGGMNFCDVESIKGCWEHMREKADLVLHHCGDLKPKINSKV